MYSKIWWRYSVATLGLLVFSLILTYQKPTVRKYQAWQRNPTQEKMSPDDKIELKIFSLLSDLESDMSFYAAEQSMFISTPSIRRADLPEIKLSFIKKLEKLNPLINQLSPESQSIGGKNTKIRYEDNRDTLIFKARLFSQTILERPAGEPYYVELLSEEDLEQTLSSREHATLIRVAIEETLTFHIAAIATHNIAAIAVHNTLDLKLEDQITLRERSTLVRYARQSKANIVTLEQKEPTSRLVTLLKKQHNAAASLFEFTHASAHID